ncbi:MAG: zinc ribbon domain-containing protein [Firmicutes bacterium]|nr:zinc ribbon domain-containing protein [Bacillota bacterium]
MPTYEYNCPKCGKFDFFQKITAEPLKACPTCGAEVVRVISGGTGVIYKGSGFYTTDYARKGSTADETKAS